MHFINRNQAFVQNIYVCICDLELVISVVLRIKGKHYRQKHSFFYAPVKFEILGFLVFHKVFFQT